MVVDRGSLSTRNCACGLRLYSSAQLSLRQSVCALRLNHVVCLRQCCSSHLQAQVNYFPREHTFTMFAEAEQGGF